MFHLIVGIPHPVAGPERSGRSTSNYSCSSGDALSTDNKLLGWETESTECLERHHQRSVSFIHQKPIVLNPESSLSLTHETFEIVSLSSSVKQHYSPGSVVPRCSAELVSNKFPALNAVAESSYRCCSLSLSDFLDTYDINQEKRYSKNIFSFSSVVCWIYLDRSSLELRPYQTELGNILSTAQPPVSTQFTQRVRDVLRSFGQRDLVGKQRASQVGVSGSRTFSARSEEEFDVDNRNLPLQRSHILFLFGVPSVLPPEQLLEMLMFSSSPQGEDNGPDIVRPQSARILHRLSVAASYVDGVDTMENVDSVSSIHSEAIDFHAVILVFGSQQDADAFYWHYHGMYFQTLYDVYFPQPGAPCAEIAVPEKHDSIHGCCYFIYLASVTYRLLTVESRELNRPFRNTLDVLGMPSKIGFAAQASLRSVPTCPVCLERVDVSVFGILTRSVAWMLYGPDNNCYFLSCPVCYQIYLSTRAIYRRRRLGRFCPDVYETPTANPSPAAFSPQSANQSTSANGRYRSLSPILRHGEPSCSEGHLELSDSTEMLQPAVTVSNEAGGRHSKALSRYGCAEGYMSEPSSTSSTEPWMQRRYSSFSVYKSNLKRLSLSCIACNDARESWICLICAHKGCGRYKMKHAQQHAMGSKHRICLQLLTGHIWDYDQEAFVHRRIVYPSAAAVIDFQQIIRLAPALPFPPLPNDAPSGVDKPQTFLGASDEKHPNTIQNAQVTVRSGSGMCAPTESKRQDRSNKPVTSYDQHCEMTFDSCQQRSPRASSEDSVKGIKTHLLEKRYSDDVWMTKEELNEMPSYENLCSEFEVLLASHLDFQKTLYQQRLRDIECDQYNQFAAKLRECDKLLEDTVKCTDEANASALQVARLETENAKLTKEIEVVRNTSDELKALNESMLRKLQKGNAACSSLPRKETIEKNNPILMQERLEALNQTISEMEQRLNELLESMS